MIERILLVQTSFLGDVILSTPVLAGIRAIHPQAEIYTLTTPDGAELLKRDPIIRECLTYDKKGSQRGISAFFRMAAKLRRHEFSSAYVLQRSYRTALLMKCSRIRKLVGFSEASLSWVYSEVHSRQGYPHDVLRNFSILGGRPLDDSLRDLRLFAPERSEIRASLLAEIPEGQRYAVLVPGSAWNTKRWHAPGYHGLAKNLLEQEFGVCVLGSEQESQVCREVCQGLAVRNLCGITTISELLFVIKNAALVVCNDSMALHVASAFKVPTVAIFCSTSPSFGFGPWRNRAEVVEKQGLSCKPCGRHGFSACPLATEQCMREVSVEMAQAAVSRVLALKDRAVG